MTNDQLELRLLGPLEIRVGGKPSAAGGAKQQALLAALLLRAGQTLSLPSLVDELWGDAPPASASHTVEVYVSRLRGLLQALGVTIARRGTGYALDLGGASLDAERFAALAANAASAAEAGDLVEMVVRADEALSLWRGPVLVDVELGPMARAEADQLSELRLATLEHRFDAQLSLGRHRAVVEELHRAASESPHRERFVAQLMVALYRSGRHPDALDVYEQFRASLDGRLGLRPSAELQRLSARIVRQEPDLDVVPEAPPPLEGEPPRRRGRRLSGLVFAGAVVILAATLSASGSAPVAPEGGSTVRAALVLPERPSESAFEESVPNNRLHWTSRAFESTAGAFGLETELLTVDEVDPDEAEVARLLREIDRGGFGVVILAGDRAAAPLIAPLVSTRPDVRFVFLDTSLGDLSLEGVRNATAVQFQTDEPVRIAGFVSASARSRDTGRPVNRVSVVAGSRSTETRSIVSAFVAGAHLARSDLPVRVDYAEEVIDPTPCERLANDQIDDGSDVVLVVAGACGLGAAAVARSRNVWVVGEDEYGMTEQAWVLTSIFKDPGRGPQEALTAFADGQLPRGGDIVLRLNDDYAVGFTMSPAVPAIVQSTAIELCADIRRHLDRPAA